jgi:ubiquinone/menaquinone biosynthesis C-methylase UbiE
MSSNEQKERWPMTTQQKACEERSVAALYKDDEVAESYIQQRFHWSWSRLLHNAQVAEVNRVIQTSQPRRVLEVAPGPARITTEVRGVTQGVMIEYSEEMLRLAKHRLTQAGCASVWDVRHGNAFELDQLQEHFDVAFTFRFIRHFQSEERARLYHGFRTCLHPHGLLVFDVVNEVMRDRLETQQPQKNPQELDVYDVTYSADAFRREMLEHGFEVVSMQPVLRHFLLQAWVSYKLDRRLGRWASRLVQALEAIPAAHSLEWIAVCRKMR